MSQVKRAQKMRGPNDGNLLWKLYSELGATRRQELLDALESGGVNYDQLYRDGLATRELGKLPISRAAIYIGFFGDEFADAIIPLKKHELSGKLLTASQQYHANEAL